MAVSRPNFGRLWAFRWGAALLLVLSAPAVSRATLISYFSSAIPGWSGTTTLSGSVLQPKLDIQYAVFDRGVFNTVFGSGDPSDGELIVYCYQLINKSSSVTISQLSIGLDTESTLMGIGQIEDPIAPAGTAASLYWFAETNSVYTSARWTFGSPAIPVGGKSQILLFASSHMPQFEGCSVSSGRYPISGVVPSPAPEPGSLISLLGLLSIGGLYRFARRFGLIV